MTPAQRLVATLVLAGTAAVALRLVSRRAPVPYPVLLALLGIAAGAVPGLPVGPIGSDAILLGFVPGLVFQAARTTSLPALRQVLLPVVVLATAGVGLTVAGIGLLARWALGLSWADGLLLGAILAPTDPIAVVAVLRRVRAPGQLVALLEGEALLNDGTGLAVFAALIASLDGGAVSAGGTLARLVVIVAVGAGIGALAGGAGAVLLGGVREAQTEILVTIAVAYGGYLAADLAHVSGIVAVVVAGLVISGSSRRFPGLHGRELDDFWAVVAFILTALLFVLIGGALPLRDVAADAAGVMAAFGIAFGARVVTVHAILALTDLRGRRLPLRWRSLTVWGGMRGGLSIAMALVVGVRANVDHRVAVLAYGVALLTILVQGGTVRLLAVRANGRDGRST